MSVKTQEIYSLNVHSELFFDIEMLISDENLKEVDSLMSELVFNEEFPLDNYRDSLKILIITSRIIRGFLKIKQNEYKQAS